MVPTEFVAENKEKSSGFCIENTQIHEADMKAIHNYPDHWGAIKAIKLSGSRLAQIL